MDISIVIPVKNEQKNITILTRLLDNVIKTHKFSYEIIYVDDGSTDNTFPELLELKKKYKSIKIIKFRKNFGKTPAMDAAFKLIKGKITITMDGDLQDDPRDIPRFVEKIRAGYDLVGGWRAKRRDLFVSKKLPSKIYNWLSRKITKVPLNDFNCGFKAYKSDVLKKIKLYGEMHRYIPVIFKAKGYKIGQIIVTHHKRKFGRTKYNFLRIFKGSFDLLFIKFWTDYSTRPLHFFGSLGVFCFFISAFLILINLIRYGLKLGVGPSLLFSGVIFLLGVQFIVLGILGEMITRTYYEKTDEKVYEIEKIIK